MIEGLRINQDRLFVDLRFLGCDDDEFNLEWDYAWIETRVYVQCNLHLSQITHACKNPTLKRRPIVFDLTALRDAFEDDYDVKGGRIKIKLTPSGRSVLYKF